MNEYFLIEVDRQAEFGVGTASATNCLIARSVASSSVGGILKRVTELIGASIDEIGEQVRQSTLRGC